ncbi:TlpA family protein disulfide reductase [Melghirimyces algeriensis]|uniref:Thiol-disulfide isomerase or thioredoxin n=1 Tax=Melghirimyces algeriensis TaxID=910412 RepID=A0A521BN28_9BACL|nr:redoxin domain-containing protein [Melghirimyces algeriensis]SMO48515.1 Thiol-disulfide isomerase or thioredoxin [Melghirimyces algeriensis]
MQRSFWRNLLVGLVILAAVGGAIWASMDKNEQQTSGSETSGEEQKKDPEQKKETKKPVREEKAAEGFRAPDFTLETLEGKSVTLSQNDGKPSLINFWASWCGPCRVEMPHLQEAYDQYKDQVNFIMVNTQDKELGMKTFLEDNGYTFPVVVDQTEEVSQKYSIFNIPQTFIVNSEGEITKRIMGSMSKEQLEEIMEELTS